GGVLAELRDEYKQYGDNWREELQKYMSDRPCHACEGARLKPFPVAVTVADKNISQVTDMSIGDATEFFNALRGAGDLRLEAGNGTKPNTSLQPLASSLSEREVAI